MDPGDILVVGAGPTGLALACSLAHQGLRPRIIERRLAPSVHSKALAIQPRSLEILEALGLIDAFLARGHRVTHLALRTGHGQLARVGLDALESPFPFILVLPQSQTERLLEAHLSALGIEVERGCALEHFQADAGGVHVDVRCDDGRNDALDARWMIGCDGAHSTVRRALDIGWSGIDLRGAFALADVRVEAPRNQLPDDQITTWFAATGVLGFIPLPRPGWFRVVAALPPHDDPGAAPTLSLFERLIAERATDLDAALLEASWTSSFEVHQRKVDTWRVGRVLLAGDAAHCHSPVGGQGMNTGLQDAWNLGWKLALVSRGQGRLPLLDSYQAERDPVARALLQGTARGTRVLTLRNPVTRVLRNQLARLVGGLDAAQQSIARIIGEIAIHYRDSPIVAEHRSSPLDARRLRGDALAPTTFGERRDFGAAPVPGDRAPDVTFGPPQRRRRLFDLLDATRHTLLMFKGRNGNGGAPSNFARERVSRYGPRVRGHLVVPTASAPGDVLPDPGCELHDRYGASAECLYLIRPDGHIAFRSQPVVPDALFAYLDSIFV